MNSRSRRAVWPSCLSVCLMLAGAGVSAQSAGTAGAAASTAAAADPKTQLSDVERAKRDADKVFQWIKFHAEKGDTKKPDKPEAPARHEVKADARPQMVKVAAPARKAEPDTDSRAATGSPGTLAAASTASTGAAASKGGSAGAAAPAADTAVADGGFAGQPSLPAGGGRPPEVVAMAAPSASAQTALPAEQRAPERVALPEEDAPLKLLSKVDPEYPRSLLAQQRNGAVTVRFTVQPDGSVESAEATRSPDRKLSAAAVAAVKQWRFAPIGRPRSVSVEIGFQME